MNTASCAASHPNSCNEKFALHNALIEAVQKQDLDVVDYLLKNGADPNFRCVKEATQQENVQSLTLMANELVPPKLEVFSEAFALIAHYDELWDHEPCFLVEIHKVLLSGGALGDPVDRPFTEYLASAHPVTARFVQIALSQPAALSVDFENREVPLHSGEEKFISNHEKIVVAEAEEDYSLSRIHVYFRVQSRRSRSSKPG